MIKIRRDEQTGFDDLHYRMYENEVKMQKLKNMGTDDRKLEFLQRFGWLIQDSDAKTYSAKFKPQKR